MPGMLRASPTSASLSNCTRLCCEDLQLKNRGLPSGGKVNLDTQFLGVGIHLRRNSDPIADNIRLRRQVSFLTKAVGETAESQVDGAISARERRKMRNEKRQEMAEKKAYEQDQLQDEMSRRKRKSADWDKLLDQNRLANYGVRWWMLQVASQSEQSVADELTANFARVYPGRPFQALVPIVPIFNTSEDGTVTLTKQKLFPGTVLVQCQLDKDTIGFTLSVWKARAFIGHMMGPRFREKLVPSPVSPEEIEKVMAAVREGEQEEERLKLEGKLTEARKPTSTKKKNKKKEAEEKEKEEEEQEEEEEEGNDARKWSSSIGKTKRAGSLKLPGVLEAGATVKVTAGPFVDCTGKVAEVMPEKERVKVMLTIFGRLTPVELKVNEVVVTKAEEDKKERQLPMVDFD